MIMDGKFTWQNGLAELASSSSPRGRVDVKSRHIVSVNPWMIVKGPHKSLCHCEVLLS